MIKRRVATLLAPHRAGDVGQIRPGVPAPGRAALVRLPAQATLLFEYFVEPPSNPIIVSLSRKPMGGTRKIRQAGSADCIHLGGYSSVPINFTVIKRMLTIIEPKFTPRWIGVDEVVSLVWTAWQPQPASFYISNYPLPK